MIPRIPLPNPIDAVIGWLFDQGNDALAFIARQMEGLYSALRGWLWVPIKSFIGSLIAPLDDLLDAILGLPGDIEAFLSKLDDLILTGVQLTADFLFSLIIENLLDFLEELWNVVEGYIDSHWDDA